MDSESDLRNAYVTLEHIETLVASSCRGGWVHENACRALASAYRDGINKLRTQLAEASTEEREFLKGPVLRWAVQNLGLLMKAGEGFVMACRCETEHDGSWMRAALTKGLSTDAVDTHLHDFIVALTATSDAIEEGTEGSWRHDELQLLIQKPDIFWRGREAMIAGRLLIPGEQLDEQRSHDLQQLRLRVSRIDTNNGQLQGIAKFLQARLEDQQKLIEEGKIGRHLLLPPGVVIVGWEGVHMVELISERQSCSVHKVYWTPLGEDTLFALKEYPKSSRESFKLEAQIHLRLHHPNVVHCICLLEEQNKCGLLMELMDETLSQFLEKRHEDMNLAEKVDIMLNIAKGMEYVHGKGVIHRDLKTENVLVKQSQSGGKLMVKVADFNVAKAKAEGSSYTTRNVGTSVFRAPEVLEEDENSPKYKKSADVYSFAMVCFHIVAGKEPFEGQHGFPSRGAARWRMIRDGERPNIDSQLADDCCPPYLKHCIKTWWDQDSQCRPEFREICRVLRHLYGALLRCSNPLTQLPFVTWDKAAWKAARKATLKSMREWEKRREMQDWREAGHASQYTRVNEIPYEMLVMRMSLESKILNSGCLLQCTLW